MNNDEEKVNAAVEGAIKAVAPGTEGIDTSGGSHPVFGTVGSPQARTAVPWFIVWPIIQRLLPTIIAAARLAIGKTIAPRVRPSLDQLESLYTTYKDQFQTIMSADDYASLDRVVTGIETVLDDLVPPDGGATGIDPAITNAVNAAVGD